jgi:hypothetical protein
MRNDQPGGKEDEAGESVLGQLLDQDHHKDHEGGVTGIAGTMGDTSAGTDLRKARRG